MSDFNWVPSPGTMPESSFRTRTARFGDGYEQSAPDGINTVSKRWTVVFENILTADAKTILDFLEGKKGSTSFTWTPPAPWNTEIRVKCRETPNFVFTGPLSGRLTAVFEQVFAP
jgi:phage-related protein